MKNKVQILHQDEALILVNKPANYLSIPDRYDTHKASVLGFLRQKFEEVYTVHRLDMETSGIMCFARTKAAHKHLSQQFENRTVDKIYHCLVEGIPNPASGNIDKSIATHPHKPGKMIVAAKGKKSLTLYRILEKFKNYSLIEANIKTGRTHQIRVHFSAIGHPLMVDPLYGRKTAFFLSELKLKKYRSNREEEERPLMSRCTLHAHYLSLNHPVTGEKIALESILPKDFKALLNQLRKWSS